MNKNLLHAGDVISVGRNRFHVKNLYRHYGVYIGNNRVVHFTSLGHSETNARLAFIQETSLEEFLVGGLCVVNHFSSIKYSKNEIVARAKSCIGKGLGLYGLVFNNCEHFANWCASGKYYSSQVEKVAGMIFGKIGEKVIDFASERIASKRWQSVNKAA